MEESMEEAVEIEELPASELPETELFVPEPAVMEGGIGYIKPKGEKK